MRERFDVTRLDPDDPFEIDSRNRPHLAKHPPFTETTVFDAWDDEPLLWPARADGPADWIMLADIGDHVVSVPLAPGATPSMCRPIGVYRAARAEVNRYRRALEEHP